MLYVVSRILNLLHLGQNTSNGSKMPKRFRISDFDESGMFREFQRLWLEYDLERRDQLSLSVY